MNRRPTMLPTLLALLCGALAAQGRVVLPPGYDGVEASSSHEYPWASAATWAPLGCRVQMVYDSLYFTAQGWNGPFTIERLGWRADGVSNPVTTGGSYQNVTIELSTAAVDHRALGASFQGNHGGDRVMAHAGTVALLPTGNLAPNTWYIDVVLTTPFVYDPANGDLLVDVAVPASWSGGTPAATDVETGGSFGRVVEASMLLNRVASTATSGIVLHDVAHVLAVGFRGGQQATAGTFGTGCAAPQRQPLSLAALSRPVLGASFDVGVDNLPPGTVLGVFVLGLAPIPAGLDLGALGAPGCRQYVALPGSSSVVFVPLGAVGLHAWSLPAQGSLAGLAFAVQGAAAVPGVNALGLLTSNGVDAVLGAF